MARPRLLRFIVLLLFVGLTYRGAEAQPSTKFIELGWDIPSTTQLPAFIDGMLDTLPADMIMVDGLDRLWFDEQRLLHGRATRGSAQIAPNVKGIDVQMYHGVGAPLGHAFAIGRAI